MEKKRLLEGASGYVLVLRSKPDLKPKEDQFLSGLLTIGWSMEEGFKGKSRDEIKKMLEDAYADEDYEAPPLVITQIMNFVQTPKKSLILTPSLKNPERIHVFLSQQEYQFDPARINDGNPHVILGEHLVSISRYEFPDQIQRALKAARKTVTNFSKYFEAIVETINKHITPEGEAAGSEEKDDPKDAAIATLQELLKSDSDEVRLKAALALMEMDKDKKQTT